MKLPKELKNFIYALISLVALVLIFWIWSGGGGLEAEKAEAAQFSSYSNISSTSTEHFAWNDMIGWIDFFKGGTGVLVKSRELLGNASSSVGDISMNCSDGGYCGTANYKVKNDGYGNLSGWAWNDLIGWISFCGTDVLLNATSGCPYTGVRYQVLVYNPGGAEAPPSDFFGWAWNDIVGWISFNCFDMSGPANCSDPGLYELGYKVRTSWFATSTYGDVYSSVFDTGVSGGAQFNSVGFNADLPTGTAILLQFATECAQGGTLPNNCTNGDWKFIGSDGTTSTFYRVDPGYPDNSHSYGSRYVGLKNQYHNNSRYFRYRIRLKSNKPQTASPVVYDVTVNWSP